jgi:Alanyl-tRNA synthetase
MRQKNLDALALFEEKYGDTVRIIEINEFSREFCGGTHVSNTGEIGMLKIISEFSISSGVRRIEAITGIESLKYVNHLEKIVNSIATKLEVSRDNIESKIDEFMKIIKEQEKEIKKLQSQLASKEIERFLENPILVKGEKVIVAILENVDKDVHANTADVLSQKLGKGVVILFNKNNESNVSIIVKVSKELINKFNAGHIAKKIASYLGGGGGGSPIFAQAGGKEVKKLEEVVKNISNFLED